jgi:hypothetical protein
MRRHASGHDGGSTASWTQWAKEASSRHSARQDMTLRCAPDTMHGGSGATISSASLLNTRSWRYLPGFLIQSFRVARQAKLAAGSLAVSVLRDANLAFWTRTVWREERAMRSFMQAT